MRLPHGPLRRRRARQALENARLLDQIVDSQLPLLPGLPEAGRRRSAGYLAELVMLAQDYRHYAAGWIDRAELADRGRATAGRLDRYRQRRPSVVPFAEPD